jgi:hypothetical protein
MTKLADVHLALGITQLGAPNRYGNALFYSCAGNSARFTLLERFSYFEAKHLAG